MVATCPMQGGLYGWGWLFQILIFIAFFIVVWWLIRGAHGARHNGMQDKPIDILKKRLASGEISKKEFEGLKKDIE